MKRVWVIVLALVVALIAAVAAIASSGDDDQAGGYQVRAVFDSAAFVIPGSNVKIGGVIVGGVDDVGLDEQNRAVVTFSIDEPGFQDFRRDANCWIGLQSLIGEQFIECRPTQKRAEGVAPAPRLAKAKDGPAKGTYPIALDQTRSPVGPDLINNIMRVPERERLRLIVNEFGAAVGGNGAGLREAIHRANPTLKQANELVEILARQNRLIEQLTIQSDAILEPWAANRANVAGFIRTAGQAAKASADKGDALEANFEKFPAFLAELKPAAERISALSDQVGPAVANLSAEAPALNTAIKGLGPFVKASGPALVTLGDAADRGSETFPRIAPLVEQISDLAEPLGPVVRNLSDLGGSFDQTGGIDNLVRLVYYFAGTLNGKDATAHYLRTKAVPSGCVERSPTRSPSAICDAHLRSELVREVGASSRGNSPQPSDVGTAKTTSSSTTVEKRLSSMLGPETESKP